MYRLSRLNIEGKNKKMVIGVSKRKHQKEALCTRYDEEKKEGRTLNNNLKYQNKNKQTCTPMLALKFRKS
jgi:hypothetical protein